MAYISLSDPEITPVSSSNHFLSMVFPDLGKEEKAVSSPSILDPSRNLNAPESTQSSSELRERSLLRRSSFNSLRFKVGVSFPG